MGNQKVVVHCIVSAEDMSEPTTSGELGAPLQREQAAAFPASRLTVEFPTGSVCACISGHGSAAPSVSSERFSKGGQSLQGRFRVRKEEFSLIHHWHLSPEQRGSACVTMSLLSELEEKMGSCSGRNLCVSQNNRSLPSPVCLTGEP